MSISFNKIRIQYLHTLCCTITESQVRNLGDIKRRYLDKALLFNESLQFLQSLSLVSESSAELAISSELEARLESFDEFKRFLVKELFTNQTEAIEPIKAFLSNFSTVDGNVIFLPTEIEKIRYSEVRNLLLELEFIRSFNKGSQYEINADYVHLFSKVVRPRTLSPEQLKRQQEQNNSIGLAAEHLIIEYELKRLENLHLKHEEILHVSKTDVLAGYDIRSFEDHLDSNSNRIVRHIEVKAVSGTNYSFYLSRNELDVAAKLGDSYYLYLLPAIGSNSFALDMLEIIPDPLKNVYSNPSDWAMKEESFSFTKRNLK